MEVTRKARWNKHVRVLFEDFFFHETFWLIFICESELLCRVCVWGWHTVNFCKDMKSRWQNVFGECKTKLRHFSFRIFFKGFSKLIHMCVCIVFSVGNENVDHWIQVIEKRQKVKRHLAPALVHGVVELVTVHNRCRIVETGL